MAEQRIKYYMNSSNKTDLDEPRLWKLERAGFRCAKIFMIIFNTFFWLLGWILIGVGISLRGRSADINTQPGDFSAFGEDHASYSAAAELCLSIGCITVIVVLLACCGAHTENHIMLGTYLGIVVIMLCFEVGAIAITSLYREKVEQRIINDIKFTMDVYEQPHFEAITNSIDSFQKTFHCCGCIGYQDWYNSTWGKRHRGNVPSSCLKKDSLLEVFHQRRINTTMNAVVFDINTNGCFEHVRDYIVKNLYFFGTFVVWIIGIQLVGLAFSVCLFCKIRSHKTDEVVCRYQSINVNQ